MRYNHIYSDLLLDLLFPLSSGETQMAHALTTHKMCETRYSPTIIWRILLDLLLTSIPIDSFLSLVKQNDTLVNYMKTINKAFE